MGQECGTCGYRVNLTVAQERGLASRQLSEFTSNIEYCYYYNGTIRRAEHRNCPHWVSYTELDCETNPPH